MAQASGSGCGTGRRRWVTSWRGGGGHRCRDGKPVCGRDTRAVLGRHPGASWSLGASLPAPGSGRLKGGVLGRGSLKGRGAGRPRAGAAGAGPPRLQPGPGRGCQLAAGSSGLVGVGVQGAACGSQSSGAERPQEVTPGGLGGACLHSFSSFNCSWFTRLAPRVQPMARHLCNLGSVSP